jgi:hypothetical protein
MVPPATQKLRYFTIDSSGIADYFDEEYNDNNEDGG